MVSFTFPSDVCILISFAFSFVLEFIILYIQILVMFSSPDADSYQLFSTFLVVL